MSTVTDADIDAAVQEFLEAADAVFHEYEQGYMDADAALARLDARLDSLREVSDRTD